MCDLCRYANDSDCSCDCSGKYKETLSKVDLENVVFSTGKEKITMADLGGAKDWFKCKKCGHYVPDALRYIKLAAGILLKRQGYKCAICGEHFIWINYKAPKMYVHYTKLDNGHKPKDPLALDELQILCENCSKTAQETFVRRVK